MTLTQINNADTSNNECNCSDNIPTYKIKSWPANSTFFDSDLMARPFPSLFNTDSNASLAGLIKDPKKCHSTTSS